MSKNDFRAFFAEIKPFITFAPFLKSTGIAKSNFSLFMKGEPYDYALSLEKLILLRLAIIDFCKKIA